MICDNFKYKRTKKFLYEGIKKFNLNLIDKVIFTEAASGSYAYTPISAAVAGAKKVYVIAKDSKYGKKEDIANDIYKLADEFNVKSKVEVVFDKTRNIVSQCDIITNNGFVRPIDKYMIDMMKPTAVIPLMWETWEVRKDEIDLDYCKEKEIVVLGTNENECGLNLYNATGMMALKMLFDSGISIYNDYILVISECPTGNFIADTFEHNNLKFYLSDLSSECKEFVNRNLDKFDAIIIAEHIKKDVVLGKNGFIDINNLLEKNPNVIINHIFGNLDVESMNKNNLFLYPKQIASYGYMSYSLDNIDSRAVIELMQAGLKVGEIMANYRQKLSYSKTIKKSLKHKLVMGF